MRHPVPRGDGHVDSKRSNRIDMTRRYTLLSGARLIPRAPDTVQIGTDPPHCVVVMDAPGESLRILGSLDGATPLDNFRERALPGPKPKTSRIFMKGLFHFVR